MPFEELDSVRKDNMPPEASLSYHRYIRKGKEPKPDAKPRLLVTLPTVFCTSKCEKFVIMLGTGADSGKMRLQGVKKGVPGKNAVKATVHKTWLSMRFGYIPKFGDESFDGVRCAVVKIDDDNYDLIFPDYLTFEEKVPAIPLRKTA